MLFYNLSSHRGRMNKKKKERKARKEERRDLKRERKRSMDTILAF